MQAFQESLSRRANKNALSQIALTSRGYPFILALGYALIFLSTRARADPENFAYLYLEYLVNRELGFVRRGLMPRQTS